MTTCIHVVSPSFNSEETILRTLHSVATQAGNFRVRHHVQDGGSTDDTLQILQGWQQRLRAGLVDLFCQGVDFTFDSCPDKGMYNAIHAAINSVDSTPQTWTGWINADDLINPGAFELLASIDSQLSAEQVDWISGHTHVAWNDLTVAWGDRPVNREIISNGLCDGTHWSFVQQEGTFFRRWLWDAIQPETGFARFRYAGDWNLWRLMAQHAHIYQVPWALGTFVRREGQISQTHREKYMAEIESVLPLEQRRKRLLALRDRPMTRVMLETKYHDRVLRKMSYPMSLNPWLGKVLGTTASVPHRSENSISPAPPVSEAAPAVAPTPIPHTVASPSAVSTEIPGMVSLDAHWQFPAITEQHAFLQAARLLGAVDGVCYLAFPWATLIDHLQTASSAAPNLRQELDKLVPRLRGHRRIVTVCQHVYLKRYLDLFEAAGVTDIFWSHASRDDTSDQALSTITIYPFPLFPVQSPTLQVRTSSAEDRYLYSFVGAKSVPSYLTDVREWIVDHLSDHPRACIRSRDDWHYQKIVYEHQIAGKASEADNLVDAERSREFCEILGQSTFTLCPSGSGPNSIRLWEAIAAGSIPVILPDTYQAPGDPHLWEAGTIRCREDIDAVKRLADRLEAIAEDPSKLAAMRSVLPQLWTLYGPECFIHDIQQLYLSIATKDLPPVKLSKTPKPEQKRLAENFKPDLAAPRVPLARHAIIFATGQLLSDAKGFHVRLQQDPVFASKLKSALHDDLSANADLLRSVITHRSREWPELKALL